jgi:hypothetical protein
MYKLNRRVTHHVYQGRVLHTLKLNHKTTNNCHSGVKNCFRMQIVYITNRIEISSCVYKLTRHSNKCIVTYTGNNI